MMKKLMLLALALCLMLGAAAAEAPAAIIPVEIIPHTEGMLHMSDAVRTAEAALAVVPAECLTRAELVRMSDGSCQWVVSIFDLTSFADGWTIALDAANGDILSSDATTIGYFDAVTERWEAVRGPEELWTLEEKFLFDTLYTMNPTYGMPLEGDMTSLRAMEIAAGVVGVEDTSAYDVGFGYIMGAGDGQTHGVWEVYFVQNGEMVYKVNLDAVNGDIYLVEPDESGNG